MLRWAMPTEDIAAVADIVRVHGAERADVAALVMGERIVTYGELHARSSQAANAFRAAGVGFGDRVAFVERTASNSSKSHTDWPSSGPSSSP